MTYSHNSVSNNLKMTTAAAAAATTTIRLKNNNNSGGGYQHNRTSPPSTPTIITAHSNSIASSTNNQAHHPLSSSPPGCFMSSGASTSSCSSSSSSYSSSLGSTGNGSGSNYFAQRQQQQRNNWQQMQSQQRHSPQQGSYFGNNNNMYQGSSGKKKQHQQQQLRSSPNSVQHSPAVILGSGVFGGAGASGRKQRSKHGGSPLICSGGSGKISPTSTHPVLTTALTHFAGSKCFDAPAPQALPKPPQHWTLSSTELKVASSAGPGLQSVVNAARVYANSGHANLSSSTDAHTCGGHVVKSSKRNLLDDFDTHNLKLLLNVQS